MTLDNKTSKQEDENTVPTENKTDTDWHLQTLVSTANTTGLEFGVTLLVEGLIVSGNLIGGNKYFETFADNFSNGFRAEEETKEELRQAISSQGEIYNAAETDEEIPPPEFIHLEDARFFSPGGNSIPTENGTLWRGKISSVSGFTLGSLSVA